MNQPKLMKSLMPFQEIVAAPRLMTGTSYRKCWFCGGPKTQLTHSRMRGVLLLLPALVLLCVPGFAFAEQHTDYWCADAVEFSAGVAAFHNLGRDRANVSHGIDTQYVTFKQEYPALSRQDMHELASAVFDYHWTRLDAVKAVVRGCGAAGHASSPAYRAAGYLSTGHSADWCADAVDYGMLMAPAIKIGYTAEMLNKLIGYSHDAGVCSNVSAYYLKMYPALSSQDMVNLTQLVYDEKWSRFAVADNISHACRISDKVAAAMH